MTGEKESAWTVHEKYLYGFDWGHISYSGPAAPTHPRDCSEILCESLAFLTVHTRIRSRCNIETRSLQDTDVHIEDSFAVFGPGAGGTTFQMETHGYVGTDNFRHGELQYRTRAPKKKKAVKKRHTK